MSIHSKAVKNQIGGYNMQTNNASFNPYDERLALMQKLNMSSIKIYLEIWKEGVENRTDTVMPL